MAQDGDDKDDDNFRDIFANTNGRDLATQAVLSIVFGLAAFLAFCVLRPRWTSLYLARKKRRTEAAPLPPLPPSLFGWIPVVYKITEEEVLGSAGLDAFVFLAFFKMAIKYVAFMAFFALTVVWPVNAVFNPDPPDDDKKSEQSAIDFSLPGTFAAPSRNSGDDSRRLPWDEAKDYLWMYFILVYLFSAVGVFLIVKETQRMIRVRQNYLASHTSISDRTIRLSGIPQELRDEEKLKETIENLEIGKVESVTLCRDWEELDSLMEKRGQTLRQLEAAWTEHLGATDASKKARSLVPVSGVQRHDEERTGLLSDEGGNEGSHVHSYDRPRPEKRIWYGFLSLQSRKVDAIDYYEEHLRRLDERITAIRRKRLSPVPLAFVTMDSTAACQMACQAIIDPQPMRLVANPAPSPSGVVWRNTYMPRQSRMFRSWTITAFILILTIFWSFLLVPIATLQTLQSIRIVAPGFADFLEEHKTFQSLIKAGVPTLLVAILNAAVPYFYEYLSYMQGMTSLSDIEMSLISKNFFFTFFNLFVVFTVLGTIGRAAPLWDDLKNHLSDLTKITWSLAHGLTEMTNFYQNYIVLQTLGIFPFRLLQFGSVSLYPFYRFGAKTPRDYSELSQPSNFTYGFFIPQTVFMLIICIAYSVLKYAERVQLFGLVYFVLGAFIYKYQLLYAMDHRQFSTGKAWPMMCTRVIVGLVVFQLVTAGQLAILKAFIRSVLVVPLLIATIWFGFWYRRTYEPLMKNIALRSLREAQEVHMAESIMSGGSGEDEERIRRSEALPSEARVRFINPNMVSTLEEPWISRREERAAEVNGNGDVTRTEDQV